MSYGQTIKIINSPIKADRRAFLRGHLTYFLKRNPIGIENISKLM